MTTHERTAGTAGLQRRTRRTMRAYGLDLPEYPWETLIPYRKLAAEHPGGTIDLSIRHPGR